MELQLVKVKLAQAENKRTYDDRPLKDNTPINSHSDGTMDTNTSSSSSEQYVRTVGILSMATFKLSGD